VYAVSIPGVKPSACITWFQANQACALAGKRLVRNDEWQRAAAGTPDPGEADDGSTTCVTYSAVPAKTGSRSTCKSSWGVFDMIGNVEEWVADWSDLAANSTDWMTIAGISDGDRSRFGGPETRTAAWTSIAFPVPCFAADIQRRHVRRSLSP